MTQQVFGIKSLLIHAAKNFLAQTSIPQRVDSRNHFQTGGNND